MGVSVKTIERDIEVLRAAGHGIDSTPGRRGGVRLTAVGNRSIRYSTDIPNSESTSKVSVSEYAYIGRHESIKRANEIVDRTRQGHGQVLAIVGEPGIGKTRTAEQVAANAEENGSAIYWGRCHDLDGTPPYLPWLQLIRRTLPNLDDTSLVNCMGSGATVLASLVPEIHQRIREIQSPVRVRDAASAQFRIFDSIWRFFDAIASESPLALVLEDVHWADSATLGLLQYFASELATSKIILIVTFRNVETDQVPEFASVLGDMARHSHFHRMPLSGLNRIETTQFLASMLGNEPTDEVISSIYSRTDGSPFYITEIARMLSVDTGDPGHLIPATVREVISRRLARVSPGCLLMLRVAAVIGREFSVTTLERSIANGARDSLTALLKEAESANLIERVKGSNGRCQFVHALIHETLLGQIAHGDLIELHLKVGTAIEPTNGLPNPEISSELVRHFHAAVPVAGADQFIKYCLVAGDQSLDQSAAATAKSFFELPLSTLTAGEINRQQRGQLLYGLGRAQADLLESDSVRSLSEAASIFIETGNVNAAVDAAATYVSVFSVPYRDLAEMRAAVLAIDGLTNTQLSRLKAQQARGVGMFERFEEFLAMADEAVEHARIAERNDLVVEALFARSVILTSDPYLLTELAESAVTVLSAAAPGMHAAERADSYAQLAMTRYMEGKSKTSEYLRLGMQEAVKSESRSIIMFAHMMNGVFSTWWGDWEDAREYFNAALALNPNDPRLLGDLAKFLYVSGNVDDGQKVLDRLSPPHSLEWERTRSACLRLTGSETVLSEIQVNAARNTIEEGTGYQQLAGARELAANAIFTGDSRTAAAYYQTIKRLGDNLEGGSSNLALLGCLDIVMGRLSEGVENLDRALESVQRMEGRPHVALVAYSFAKALMGASPKKFRSRIDELLQLAEETSRDLGMAQLLENVVAMRTNFTGRAASWTTSNPAGLSNREMQVLQLLTASNTNNQIADKLYISESTVIRHVSHIFEKIGATSRVQAAAWAIENGLFNLDIE